MIFYICRFSKHKIDQRMIKVSKCLFCFTLHTFGLSYELNTELVCVLKL